MEIDGDTVAIINVLLLPPNDEDKILERARNGYVERKGKMWKEERRNTINANQGRKSGAQHFLSWYTHNQAIPIITENKPAPLLTNRIVNSSEHNATTLLSTEDKSKNKHDTSPKDTTEPTQRYVCPFLFHKPQLQEAFGLPFDI